MTSLREAQTRMLLLVALLLVVGGLMAVTCAAQVVRRIEYNRCMAQQTRVWPEAIAKQLCSRRVR